MAIPARRGDLWHGEEAHGFLVSSRVQSGLHPFAIVAADLEAIGTPANDAFSRSKRWRHHSQSPNLLAHPVRSCYPQ
jgi:hypothetical protein